MKSTAKSNGTIIAQAPRLTRLLFPRKSGILLKLWDRRVHEIPRLGVGNEYVRLGTKQTWVIQAPGIDPNAPVTLSARDPGAALGAKPALRGN